MQAINFKINRKKTDSPEMQKLKRNSIYWICQSSGWLLYFIANVVATALFDTLTWPRALLLFFISGAGLLLTHLYRNRVKKKNWISLPLKKIVPLILLASLVIGTVIYTPYFILNFYLKVFEYQGNLIASLLLGIVNVSSICLVWSLIYFSFHVFENYKRSEIEAYIWEAAVKDFELKTLKSQLNPHFMFNAMNGIRALIEEDPEAAKTAITRLSNILRYSLKIERSETVPLEEEMQTVKDYLLLEGIRFEERLKFNLSIDPKSCKVEIPPMMIQTLVENGIKHGIAKKTNGGIIKIDTQLVDSRLYIKITNTGQLDTEALKLSHGFGVSNTRHRLNLLYGEAGSFTIINEGTENVSAEIVIPTGGIK